MSTIGDEDDGLEPPSARRVAERALVLSAAIARGFIVHDAGCADAERLRDRLRTWLREAGVDGEIEDDERLLLEIPLGQATPQTIADTTWQSEGLAVLAWALGRARTALFGHAPMGFVYGPSRHAQRQPD